MLNSQICEQLGIKYPIIQGAMAWISESSLASAVSEAGGLGIIAAGGAPAEHVREEILKAKELTDKPFGVNIMLMSPHADDIAKSVNVINPGIAIGTVYNILELFVEKGIIKKVKTDEDKMRYDPILLKHHHLYDEKSSEIYDYIDEELDNMIEDYFSKKNIDGFDIKDIRLQIIGEKKK